MSGAPARSEPSLIFLVGGLLTFGIVVAVVLLVIGGKPQSAGPERGITLRDVAEDAESYRGDVVTVSGEVDESLLPRPESGFSFVIGDRAAVEVLVVPDRPQVVPRGLDGDHVVRVTGTVGRVAPEQDTGADVLEEGGRSGPVRRARLDPSDAHRAAAPVKRVTSPPSSA